MSSPNRCRRRRADSDPKDEKSPDDVAAIASSSSCSEDEKIQPDRPPRKVPHQNDHDDNDEESEDEGDFASAPEHEDSETEVENAAKATPSNPSDAGQTVATAPTEDETQSEGEVPSTTPTAEESAEGVVDDDLDRRNPQYIPKKGMFYEHDDRIDSDDEAEARLAEEEEAAKRKKRVGKSETANRWGHDKFMEMEQTPKSKEELVDIYGYDIRGEDNAPRARRRRRYGRGPNKYTRNWEDEEAYALAQGRGRGGRKPGGARRGPPGPDIDENEYPALANKESHSEARPAAPNVEESENGQGRESHRGRGGRGGTGGAPPSGGRGGRGGRGRGSHRGHPNTGHSGRFEDSDSHHQRHQKPARTVERSKSMKETFHSSKDSSEPLDRRMARTHISDHQDGPKSSRFPAHGSDSASRGNGETSKKNGGHTAPPKRYSSLRQPKHNANHSQNSHADGPTTNTTSSRYSHPDGKPKGLSHSNQHQQQQQQQQPHHSGQKGQNHHPETAKVQSKERAGDFKDQQPIMVSPDANPTYNTVVYPVTGVPGVPGVPSNSSFMNPTHVTPPPITQGIQGGPIPGSAPSPYINPNGMMNYGPPPVQYTPVTVPISVSLVGVPAGVPPHPEHFVHGAIPLAGGSVPPGTPLIAAQHLGATVVSSPEQVLMAAAASMGVATSPGAAPAAPPPGTQGYAEVRGGVTYFNPTVQPVLNAPRAVSKRPKAAIAIVDPSSQTMPDGGGSDGDSPELVANGGADSPEEHAHAMEPSLGNEPTEIAT